MKIRSIIDPKKKEKIRAAIRQGDSSLFGIKRKAAEEPVFASEKLTIKKQQLPPDQQDEMNKKLVKSVANNDFEKAKEAIVNGADINAESMVEGNSKYIWKQTPLEIAVNEDNPDMVRLLLANGADMHHRDQFGITITMEAASEGKLEALKVLAQNLKDIDEADNAGRTTLMFAAKGGNVKIAEFLLSKGADINRNYDRGGSALYIAAMEGKAEMVEFLIQKGAQVNAKVDGATILAHVLCLKKYPDVERCLLLHGAREWVR